MFQSAVQKNLYTMTYRTKHPEAVKKTKSILISIKCLLSGARVLLLQGTLTVQPICDWTWNDTAFGISRAPSLFPSLVPLHVPPSVSFLDALLKLGIWIQNMGQQIWWGFISARSLRFQWMYNILSYNIMYNISYTCIQYCTYIVYRVNTYIYIYICIYIYKKLYSISQIFYIYSILQYCNLWIWMHFISHRLFHQHNGMSGYPS